MTEHEWLTATQPTPMLRGLEHLGRLSARKHQLWLCACLKRLGRLLTDPRLRAAVVARDMYADDLITTHQLRNAEAAAQHAVAEMPTTSSFGTGVDGIKVAAAPVWAASAVLSAVEEPLQLNSISVPIISAVRCDAARALQHKITAEWAKAVRDAEWAAQAELVREIFGNPFRPLPLDRSCSKPTVNALALTIYDEQDRPAGLFDAQRMAVLADAVEEAGCDDAELLAHLRSGGDHPRGCWAVDLVLGRG